MNTNPLLDLLSLTALKGTVVLMLALLLGLVLHKMAAARRYALWITAITVLGVLPLAIWALPAWRVLPKAAAQREEPVFEPEPEDVFDSNVPAAPPARLVVPAAASKSETSTPDEAQPSSPFFRSISWQDVVSQLPLIWLLISGLFLLRLCWSACRLRRLEATLRSGECGMLVEAARSLGLKHPPMLLIGPADAVPMVWGVFRPRLLLPQGFEKWPQEKQRGVLLHELAHLRRGDPLALWAAQWVKALHWFNPLAWLTLRQLRADQECACDDTVLRQGVRASDYAQSLLDLSRHNRLAPGLSLCALTITRCAPVEARVKAILDPVRRREGLTLRWLVGMAACALLITLPVAMLHAIDGPPLRGRILDRNGVVLAESTPEKMRSYPLQTLAAHVVGYTGKTGPEDATPTGRSALEKQHDAVLRKGKDLSLTLDARVQSLATRALNENIQRGAIVIMDPESGGILAYVSVPSYDPNRFIPTLNAADWENYLRDKDLPLFDRVSTSRSAPGAVFQPMTALAAFVSRKNPGTYECAPLAREAGGGVRFGNTTKICRISLLDGAAHGPLTLEQALSKSCSSYFFQLGTEAGYPALLTTAGHLGLQRDTDIFGAKSEPVMPAQEEIAKTHSSPRQLTDITTAFASGNGSAVSVLQMAVLYSALANGKVWDPTLTRNDAGQPRLDLNSLPGLPEGLARVRSALQNAVNDPKGRAHAAASAKVQIAALSDTHVTGRKGPNSEVFTHHHWVGGYVPAAKPALAFALCVDETSANRSADPAKLGPIIRRIVEEALALPADGSGEVKPVEEKGAAAQAQFDFNAAEISRQIKLLESESKIDLKEFKIGNGRVTIVGEVTELENALQWRKRLEEIGEKRQIGWFFSLPKSLANGRVGVEANGIYQPSKSNMEEGGKNTAGVPGPFQLLGTRAAKVIGRSSSTSAKSLVIAKGSLDGIVANCPVITSAGLVGKTGMPEPYFTEVILLTDARCQVSAKVEGSLERGILNGEKEANEVAPQLHLRFLNRDAKINIGSSVYSSGEGGVFPAGLHLGRVKDFKRGDVSGEAVVEPVVDFSTLDQVLVIEPKAEPPEQKTPSPPKPTGQAQTRQQIDGEIRMTPVLAKQWAALKRAGLLADLPARARPVDLGDKHPERQMKSVSEFHFWTSRADVRRWLVDSHCFPAKADPFASRHSLLWEPPAVEDIAADWPAPPEPFRRTYPAAAHCEVDIHTSDGENFIVTVRQMRFSILIAPDESQQPRPAGRMEPDHKKGGFAQRETVLPALDVAPQSLAPTIFAAAKPRRPFFQAAPSNLRLRSASAPENPKLERPAVLIQLREEFSSGVEPGLLHSLQKSGRMQQTLWVKAAQS